MNCPTRTTPKPPGNTGGSGNDGNKDDGKDKSELPFYLSSDTLTFPQKGGIRFINVITNSAAVVWGVDDPWKYDEWCKMEVSSTTVTFTVTENPSEEERIAEYKFTYNDYSAILTIQQLPKGVVYADDEYFASSLGGEVEVGVRTNTEYTVSIPDTDSWIRYVSTRALRSESIVFDTDSNEGGDRTAYIELFDADGENLQTIAVTQIGKGREIFYTSSDGEIVEPDTSNIPYGTEIISNTYKNGRGIIMFSAPVAEIWNRAFRNCVSLAGITLPDNITKIGEYAFYNCSNLESITIPDRVTTIGNSAFSSCSSLTSITIPDSVFSIGTSAFEYCEGLTSITIPENVEVIGQNAFANCRSLKSVYFRREEYATEFEGEPFYNTPADLKIYVPRESLESYKEYLSLFAGISADQVVAYDLED